MVCLLTCIGADEQGQVGERGGVGQAGPPGPVGLAGSNGAMGAASLPVGEVRAFGVSALI